MPIEGVLDSLGPAAEPSSQASGPPLLTWGTVSFSVSTLAFQDLRRSARYRWAAQDRVGVEPAYQFTGPAEDTIAISGAVFPTYRGRLSTLQDLRALAASGESQLLTEGSGSVLGRWFCESVDEDRRGLFGDGAPRKVAYTLTFRRDEERPRGVQDGLAARAAEVGDAAAAVEAAGAF